MWEGVPPLTVGNFFEIWVLKHRFWVYTCVMNFELTSNLARNVYDCSIQE